MTNPSIWTINMKLTYISERHSKLITNLNSTEHVKALHNLLIKEKILSKNKLLRQLHTVI